MVEDDKKREREEETEEKDEVSERPTKVAKKSDDDGNAEEPKEEEKVAGDPPAAKDKCDGSDDCGTESEKDGGGEGGKTEEKKSDTPESKKAPSASDDQEEAKGTEEEAKPAEEAKEEATAVADPSGLPDTAVDPTQVATITNPDSVLEERAELQKMLVGRVIGKGGEMIRDLQARSGCRVDVDQNVPEEAPRIITYRGTRQSIDFAKQLVATLCAEDGRDAELPLGMATRKQLIVPATSIGKIIGRGGEMIRDLQTRSKCKIQVDHSGGGVPDPQNTRQVIVTGTADSVVKAEEMIMFLVANPTMDASTAIDMLTEDKLRGGVWGSGPPYPNLPNEGRGMQGPTGYGYGGAPAPGGGYQQQPAAYGGGYSAGGTEMEIFYAAKTFMGRIIGQRGVTINDLQKRSGCDIQINQDVPHGQDCEISIKGSRQGIESVKNMLREIIEMGPNHPYAGGAGGAQQSGYPAAAYQQGGYGQAPPMQAGYPYQQQQAAPAAPYGSPYGYGSPYQQAPPYGQPQMPAYQQQPHAQPYGMPAYQQAPQQYAQPPMQAPAAVWRSANTADGQTYYYNEKTGETQWEKPAGM